MHRALLACWDCCRSCFFRRMDSENQRTRLQQRQCNCQHDRAFSQSRNSPKSNQNTKLTRKQKESWKIGKFSFAKPSIPGALGHAYLSLALNQFWHALIARQTELIHKNGGGNTVFFSEPSWIGRYFHPTRNISGTVQDGRSKETEEEELRRVTRQDNT